MIKALSIFLTIMPAITDFGKIQTFYTKYRPNKDPICSKGLYYRPGSLNKDPGGSTGRDKIIICKIIQNNAPWKHMGSSSTALWYTGLLEYEPPGARVS